MAAKIVELRDQSILVQKAAIRSNHAAALLNSVYMRERADGSRTRIRVAGVQVPKPFAPASVHKGAVAQLVNNELDFYKENSESRIQFAEIEAVLGKALREVSRSLNTGHAYPIVLIDHHDAIATTHQTKRSPCTVRLFNPVLFPNDGGASAPVVWFDYEGGVQRIAEFSEWRMDQYNRVMGVRVTINGWILQVRAIWLVGDNERLQIEMGGCTGNSICRCPLCTLPIYLFPLLPRAGHPRSMECAAALFKESEIASGRIANLDSFLKIQQAEKNKMLAHVKAMCGSMSHAPLLSVGSTFALSHIHVAPAVLHDMAQVLLDTKVFLNLKLPAEARLVVKEYIPCSERRSEMSKWRVVYESLGQEWQFVPDLASQMTATLWQKSPTTFRDAVRAQVCGLVLFFVLGARSADDVTSNYMHGIAAHLFEFMVAMAAYKARAVDFFEEAGERGTAPLRNFIRDRSNFRDNLFMGARVAEAVAARMKVQRERRIKAEAAEFSNILLAPCLFNGLAVHVETMRSFLEQVRLHDETSGFATIHGDCVLFTVGVGAAIEDITVACVCGTHSLEDGPAGTPLKELQDPVHWILTGQHRLAAGDATLDSATYDSLAALTVSPLNLEPPFATSDALVAMMRELPKSAQLTKLLRLKLPELKAMCKKHGLPESGSKDGLAGRIVAFEAQQRDQALIAETPDEEHIPRAPLVGGKYDRLDKKDLKELCRTRGLAVGGKKQGLVARLIGSDKGEVQVEAVAEQLREPPRWSVMLTLGAQKQRLSGGNPPAPAPLLPAVQEGDSENAVERNGSRSGRGKSARRSDDFEYEDAPSKKQVAEGQKVHGTRSRTSERVE